MVDRIHEIVDYKALAEHYIIRDGYVFVPLTYPYNVFDAVLIRQPQNAISFSPRLPYSKRDLDEHIALINDLKLEKAVIIADNIDFITRCPSLKYLSIIPADSAGDNFDYSPLYDMPQVKDLWCTTVYGAYEEYSTTVDYSKVKGLESVGTSNSGHLNYELIETLKTLSISSWKKKDLKGMLCSKKLDTLRLIQCGIHSLDGIDISDRLQCLYLHYNRSLKDISALAKVKKSLKALRIENCPKIEDFSVLGELENLELLELTGKNTLPNLQFIKQLKNLKTFVFDMNVLDGDLTPCLDLSYVFSVKNRKHYSIKDRDMPKGEYVRGNENIDMWRRME